jgi:hypothetical protein
MTNGRFSQFCEHAKKKWEARIKGRAVSPRYSATFALRARKSVNRNSVPHRITMYRYIRHTATNCGKRTVVIYRELDYIAVGEGLLLWILLKFWSLKLLLRFIDTLEPEITTRFINTLEPNNI